MRKSTFGSHTSRSHSLTRTCFALALLVGTSFSAAPAVQALDPERTRVISYNNDGVRLLSKNDFEGATEKFIEALKIDPEYSLARDNLSIAYNNRAIKSHNEREALKYFHLAIWLSKNNRTTESNLAAVRGKLYKDTKSFGGIVNIARDCLKHGDTAGAILEYKRALELKKDDAVAAELSKVQLPNDLKRILEVPRVSTAPKASEVADKSTAVDFGPYMAALQRKIKRHWFPPKHQKKTKHVVAVFRINRDGELSNARITNSAGKASDDAALAALKEAAPFDKLPKNSPEVVDIQFTFDYNVFKNGKKEVATKDGAGNRGEERSDSNDKEEKVADQTSSEQKDSEGNNSENPKVAEAGNPSSTSTSSSQESNLGEILKWAIPGVISFLALAGIVVFVMARQRD